MPSEKEGSDGYYLQQEFKAMIWVGSVLSRGVNVSRSRDRRGIKLRVASVRLVKSKRGARGKIKTEVDGGLRQV